MGSSNYTMTITLVEADTATATFTINPTPSDASIILYAKGYTQSGNSITVANDGTIAPTWQVYKDNYISDGGTLAKMTESVTKNITLTPFSDGNWTTLDTSLCEVVSKYYIASSGKQSGPYSTWQYIVVPVTAGKTYRVISTAGQNALLWMFFSEKPDGSSIAPISKSTNTGMTTKIADEVIAPDGATYMTVNCRINSSDYKTTVEVLS